MNFQVEAGSYPVEHPLRVMVLGKLQRPTQWLVTPSGGLVGESHKMSLIPQMVVFRAFRGTLSNSVVKSGGFFNDYFPPENESAKTESAK